jgi:BolA protein
MMTTQQLLEQKLQTLSPVSLTIQDDSALHVGHAGNTGGAHFTITIVSDAFEGLSLLKRHRLVYAAVDELMHSAIHALSIDAKTPSELIK